MIRRVIEVQKASYQALINYVPHCYPGKITLMRTSEVLVSDSSGVFAQSFSQPDYCWGELTTQPIEIHRVPGDHVTMLAEPHVKVLAERLKSFLGCY
jgi:thioesterase domain-containing protein